VRLLLEEGVEGVLPRERELLLAFHRAFRDPGRFHWYGADRELEVGRWQDRVGLLGLNLPGLEPAELAALLDAQFDIAARAGLHCAPGAHRHLGTFPQGSVRLSLGRPTTAGDMAAAAAALEEIAAAAGSQA
jgi:selenocysteine lyase/cysteine desulfurase